MIMSPMAPSAMACLASPLLGGSSLRTHLHHPLGPLHRGDDLARLLDGVHMGFSRYTSLAASIAARAMGRASGRGSRQ